MTKYERSKLRQFADTVTADQVPEQALVEETAEIISRLLMFSASPQRTVASMSLIRLAKAYGIKKIPHPAYSLNILMDILEEEQRRALERIHQ